MKSDSSEVRIVVKDNPTVAAELSQLTAGDQGVELLIKIDVIASDDSEMTGFVKGVRLESAETKEIVTHNAVELLESESTGPKQAVNDMSISELNPAELLK